MGQCGCGDYDGRWRMPGPAEGSWYVIGPYLGCTNGCASPIGITIDLMSGEDIEQWEVHKLPIIGGPDRQNSGVPILDIKALQRSIGKYIIGALPNLTEFGDELEPEYVIEEDELTRMLRDSAFTAMQTFDKGLKS